MSVWRGLRSKAPPPTRLIRQWKRDGLYPELLSQDAVNKILGTEEGVRPRRKKQRRAKDFVESYEEEESGSE